MVYHSQANGPPILLIYLSVAIVEMAILVSIVKYDVPHLLRGLSKEINEGPNWTQGQGEFITANVWNYEQRRMDGQCEGERA